MSCPDGMDGMAQGDQVEPSHVEHQRQVPRRRHLVGRSSVLDRIAVNQISLNNPTREEVISELRDRPICRS
jgi:hypothetical protein